MKMFIASGALLPTEWRAVLELPAHHQYGHVIAIGGLKREVPDLLVAGGVARGPADTMTASMRMHKTLGHMPTYAELLLAAHVVELRPGVWTFYASTHNRLVVEVTPDRGLVPVARFVYNQAARVIEVERVTGEG
jgi:hypothetical protein